MLIAVSRGCRRSSCEAQSYPRMRLTYSIVICYTCRRPAGLRRPPRREFLQESSRIRAGMPLSSRHHGSPFRGAPEGTFNRGFAVSGNGVIPRTHQYHFVIVKVCEWLPATDVVTVSVPPPFTDVSCASLMVKVWVCPPLEDVSLDIPVTGGVSTSALASVILCVWPDTREDVNVREVLGVDGPEGELEQPYPAKRMMHARAPSRLNRLSVTACSFRSNVDTILRMRRGAVHRPAPLLSDSFPQPTDRPSSQGGMS